MSFPEPCQSLPERGCAEKYTSWTLHGNNSGLDMNLDYKAVSGIDP